MLHNNGYVHHNLVAINDQTQSERTVHAKDPVRFAANVANSAPSAARDTCASTTSLSTCKR